MNACAAGSNSSLRFSSQAGAAAWQAIYECRITRELAASASRDRMQSAGYSTTRGA
jgi:hypothetical protein